MMIEVYDPAMCCSTGVCGPEPNDTLTDFAGNLKWIASQGVEVKRFNLGQEPEAFKSNQQVLMRLQKDGTAVLPIIVINGIIVSESVYPGKADLMEWAGIGTSVKMTNGVNTGDERSDLLMQLRTAVESGDLTAMEAVFIKGVEAGITADLLAGEMQAGIDIRQKVTGEAVTAANRLLGLVPGSCAPGSGCC